jgi:7-cyano-7-deazaguanine synthase
MNNRPRDSEEFPTAKAAQGRFLSTQHSALSTSAWDTQHSALSTTAHNLAVLVSGGLDSGILLAESTMTYAAVYPLYVRSGLRWEPTELLYLRHFLEVLRCPELQALHILDLPVSDLYGNHWSITGKEVPGAASPDQAVFLPGRNVLLLAKAILWCHVHEVPAVALAVLEANPFPDATPQFFTAYQEVVNQAIGGKVQVLRPYVGLTKADVLKRRRQLPLDRTFSCIHPLADRHCGQCNKCAERRRAFAAAGLTDPSQYASEIPNPKYEIRNTKQIQRIKKENPKQRT